MGIFTHPNEFEALFEDQRLYTVRLKAGADSASLCSSLRNAGLLESEVMWIVPQLNGNVSMNSSAKAAHLVRTLEAVELVDEVRARW